MKQHRFLVKIIILSASLNVLLLGLFFYLMFAEPSVQLSFKPYRELIENSHEEKNTLSLAEIFEHLRTNGIEKSNPDLLHYFCYSPQFVQLETLMARTSIAMTRKQVLQLALESGWELLEMFFEQQKLEANFSKQAQEDFLTDAYLKGSKIAGQLLKKI